MYGNGKKIPVETIPGMGLWGVKKSGRRGECKYDIFDTLLRTFVNATMYPYPV
jgi:hypothetical protein